MNTIRRTTCNRDCPDACSILLEVNPMGQPVKMRGAPDDPVTQGFLCERTSRFLDRQRSSERFLTPMWRPRKGAELEPVSWDFALDMCAQKLLECRSQSGAESVLHYRSGGSLGLLKQLSELLFENFGPVTLKRGDICSGAGEAAQELDFGICDSHDHLDLHNSRSIVLWGKNIHTSSPHLTPLLLEARQRGTRLIGVDPVRTRQASMVDHFVQPNPGTDFALAMAVAQRLVAGRLDPDPATFCDYWSEFQAMLGSRSQSEWLAIAGVEEQDADVLAQALRDRPAAIQVGWGMPRRRFGGAAVRALDALAAISGNLGIPGGGVSYYYRRRSAFDALPVGKKKARSFSEARLGQEILDAGDVRFLWVTAGNPVSMLPDSNTVRRAFLSVETVVVVDTHPTDTTDVADLVLPTLTLLEDDDLLGAYGNHYLRASQPALSAPGEALHELRIWQGLASRLGLDSLLEGSPADWKRRLLGRLGEAGVQLEDLEKGPVRNPFAGKVLFEGLRFPTATGKVQLVHETPEFPAVDPDYPYLLAAFSTPKAQASQWSVAPSDPPVVRMHPSSGAASGQMVVLETRLGQMEGRVELDDSLHPRMILLHKGGMRRTGGSPNQLTRAEETDLGGGANYYDEPVRFYPQ